MSRLHLSLSLALCVPTAGCVGDSPVNPQDGGADTSPAGDSSTDGGVSDAPEEEAGPAPGLYVDVNAGSDSNPGSLAQPFKTLAKALGVAKSGDHVYMFGGTYNAVSGDDFTTPIGDGVLVAGLSADGGPSGVVLQGTTTPLTFAGSGGLANVALAGFTTAIGATTGTQTLNGIAVSGGTAFALTGSAALTVTGLTLSGGALGGSAKNTSQLVVNGGTVAAANGSTGGSFWCTDSGKMNVDSVTFNAVSGTLFLFDTNCTSVVSKSNIGLVAGALGVSSKNNANVTLDTLTITGAQAVSGGAGTMTITGGTYNNSPAGVDEITTGSATLNITNLTLSGCGRFGIEGSGPLNASGLTITGCALGGIYTQGTVKLRSSTIKNNTGTGIYGFTGSINLDLGTTNSLGNNTIQGNSTTGVYCAGATSQTNAVGNTWNPNVQGADSNGHYANGYAATNSSGTNFNVGAQPIRLGQ